MTNFSFPDIGAKIGGKDHSTVIYATNKIRELLDRDPKMMASVKEIEDMLNRD
jgi:chromosomal replication initiator protein